MVEIIQTELPEVYLFKPKVFGDERGYFFETFRQSAFTEIGVNLPFVQDNQSCSAKGVLRGLHYQIQQAQGKFVRVLSGEIYDVAVDLRKSSPHFGQSVGVHLSAANKHALWVPPGFAHGFYTLGDDTEVLYKCTDYYAPEYERTLAWNDPSVNIEWPLLAGLLPNLSDKDAEGLNLKEAECYE